jgi:rfaE bifunctional protein kinase chain/domain
MKSYQGLSQERLRELLSKIKKVRAVLIGDMCLDVYWFADMTRSVLSRETPHFPLPVVSERMSAGAGGNAAANMAVLCDNFTPVGIIGDDWRGVCLYDLFENDGVCCNGFVRVKGRVTNAYCKPMRRGYLGFDVEDPRIDFESFEPIDEATEEALLTALDDAAKNADVLAVSDQFEYGCITPKIRARICELAERGLTTVVDSRSRIGEYKNCILKPNEIECARALGLPDAALGHAASREEILSALSALREKSGSDVCLTLGDRGCIIGRGDVITETEAVRLEPPFDTVGAGDCFLSAFSLALAAGASDGEAAVIGSLASAICVKKIGTTGSASAEEIVALFDRLATNG